MSPHDFVAQLLGQPDAAARRAFMQQHVGVFGAAEADEIAELLKETVIELMNGDTQRAIAVADLLLEYAELTANDLHRAMGLRAKAQAVMVGTGDYRQSLHLYDRAIEIHRAFDDALGEALVQMTRIWALANLGRYDEAIQKGEQALEVLKAHGRLRDLASLHNNLALVHNRVGRYAQALEMFSKAGEIFRQLGEEGKSFLVTNEGNRAWALCNTGRLRESIEVGQQALALADSLGQTTVKARIQHNMGLAYFLRNQYNHALSLFQEAKTTHLENEQHHEAALCDLSSISCLLLLRRFDDVLRKCAQVRSFFVAAGMRHEEAWTILHRAQALTELGDYHQAIGALEQAEALFSQEGNLPLVAECELGIAILLQRTGELEHSLEQTRKCIQQFDRLELTFYSVYARLVEAQLLAALGDWEGSRLQLKQVVETSQKNDLPWTLYQGYDLLGKLAKQRGEYQEAFRFFEQAIAELERLRSNVMLEYRPGFLEDKQEVYERMVDLCLETGQDAQGLLYAERAKSHALLELLAYRLDLGIYARDATDEPLVAELAALRSQREERIRFVQDILTGSGGEDGALAMRLQKEIRTVEQKITDLWHQLLVCNADYVRNASLWEVRTENVQPYLAEDTLVLEYFRVADRLVVFLITGGEQGRVEAVPLGAKYAHLERLLQSFQMNLRLTPRTAPDRLQDLEANVRGILDRLFDSLLAPIHERLAAYPRLMIVPHGSLHYLPFHALFDGEKYLIQTHQISYLPSSSLLRYCLATEKGQKACLSIGHSYGGRLPYAVEEARMVAALWRSEPLEESQATLEAFRTAAGEYRLLHLACHGEFHSHNPLFSGLVLDDGWMTTMDVFNLRLKASLVTLSACHTGRSVVGGGDELLGLMRAFLSAGSASLLLSLWAVSDRSTFELMRNFYHALQGGKSKGEALQVAQCRFLTDPQFARFRHPYFWASFFLIGDNDSL